MASHCGCLGLANRLHQGMWLLIIKYIHRRRGFFSSRYFYFSPSLYFASYLKIAPVFIFQRKFDFQFFRLLIHDPRGEGNKISHWQGDDLFYWGVTAQEKKNELLEIISPLTFICFVFFLFKLKSICIHFLSPLWYPWILGHRPSVPTTSYPCCH